MSDLGGTTKGEICLVVAAVPASLWLATMMWEWRRRAQWRAEAAMLSPPCAC